MNIEFRQFNGFEDWEWINQQVGIVQVADTTGIMAVDLDRNETVGAAVMDSWTRNSVQCHFMLTTPLVLKHSFLQCCFHFMFNVCKVGSVYGLVPGDNEKALKFNKHIGFKVKTRLEDAYEVGVDYLLVELKKEDCKFIDHNRKH